MMKLSFQFFGGRGSSGGKGAGGGSRARGGGSSVSAAQAERMIRDEPGFGSKSRISSVEIVKGNADGTVDLKFTYNTTPSRGQEYSEDVSKIIRRVRTSR